MQEQPLGGIPTVQQYRTFTGSGRFREMENFSDHFLVENKAILRGYAKKWVMDPLHQWSRQWEYPFVYSRIDALLRNKHAPKILDAGSGITFFPYFIKSLHPAGNVYCLDTDKTLEDLFPRINSRQGVDVAFSASNLKDIPFEKDWFDVVYCVSVLEHTNEYEEIIAEFHRVLKPGGRLVITFDLSLDETRDVSLEAGSMLLEALTRKFRNTENVSVKPALVALSSDAFTTHSAREIDPNLLPWKYPPILYRIISLLRRKRHGIWPPYLTVFCIALDKTLPLDPEKR